VVGSRGAQSSAGVVAAAITAAGVVAAAITAAGVVAAAITAAGVVLVVDIPHIVSFVIVAAIDVEVRHVNKGVAMERG